MTIEMNLVVEKLPVPSNPDIFISKSNLNKNNGCFIRWYR